MCSSVIFNFMFRSSASVFNSFLTSPFKFCSGAYCHIFDCVMFCLCASYYAKFPFGSSTVSCFWFGLCFVSTFWVLQFLYGCFELSLWTFLVECPFTQIFLSSSSCFVVFLCCLGFWLFPLSCPLFSSFPFLCCQSLVLKFVFADAVTPPPPQKKHSNDAATPPPPQKKKSIQKDDWTENSKIWLNLSAPSPRRWFAVEACDFVYAVQTVRSDSFWEIGCDFSAVTVRLRLRCILQWKMAKFASRCGNSLRFRLRFQKIASDCGCDAVVHLGLNPSQPDSDPIGPEILFFSAPSQVQIESRSGRGQNGRPCLDGPCSSSGKVLMLDWQESQDSEN